MLKRGTVRRVPATVIAVGILATALVGCSTAPQGECVPEGAASDLIDVQGRFGSSPRIDFPTPLDTAETQATSLITGTGTPITGNQVVRMSWVVYNGQSGEKLPNTEYEAPGLYLTSQLLEGMQKGLECRTGGSRIAIAIAPEDAFGEQGSPELGVERNDSLVMVADIIEVYPDRATGADRPVVESGFPTVVTDKNGVPGLTIPKSDPPKELKVATLKAGDGETVEADDRLIVQYTGVLWEEQTVFDSSWTKDAPAVFSTTEIVPGLGDALIGQKVGSQVLAVIPPSQAYGDAGAGSVPPGATLVFVVDILGIAG